MKKRTRMKAGSEDDAAQAVCFEINPGDDAEQIRIKKLSGACKYLISKRKTVQNISVLGILYKKSLIKDNGISFDEDLVYYSDWSFLVRVIAASSCCDGDKEALYIKRTHNDPIHMPSLIQAIGKDDFEHRVKAYDKVTGYVTDAESEIRVRFDKKMISYLASEVGPAIRKNEEKIWRKKRLPLISEMCKQFGSEAVKSSGFYRKRLIKAFICEDVKKISKLTGNKNLRNWAGNDYKRA